ncbi:MAG: PAS domain S-box protein [Bacteroidetes bacterium]|nr:PAS domain S-box protein [Bacteroidota bacterium]MBU1114655.1 PAS domain S-box protein [Bacteroidota bacterium]MBU1798969.1 PAS domain S-box protein [Bacteroidota bacterium]
MEKVIHILHLEDDLTDAELIKNKLNSAGMNCNITLVQFREEFEKALHHGGYDIILSDYRLPEYNGMTALKLALEISPDIPFIFVSGFLGEDAAIEGLTKGATDYVIKQKISRLVPAVKRALREAQNKAERKHAEDALQESEKRFRSLFENSIIGIYRTTPDGKILLANSALIKMLGYTSFNELAFRNLEKDEFEPTYDRKKFVEQMETKGEVKGFESIWNCHNGSILHIRESAHAIRDANGKIIFYDGTIEDITERKQAEIIINNQKEYLDSLLNTISDVVLNVKTKERIIEYANRAITLLLGYSPDEVIGYQSRIFYENEKDYSHYNCLLDEAISNGQNKLQAELRLKRKDDTLVYVDIRSTIILNNGEVERIISVLHDITDRKQAEEKIRVLTRGIEQSPVIVVITDIEGKVEYVNPSFTNTTGYSFDEVFGKNLSVLKSNLMDVKVYTELWDKITNGNEWSGQFINKKKNNELYWQASHIFPVKNETGEVTHFVGIMEDITEKIKQEEELSKYRLHLEELIAERTGELSNVNKLLQHELEKQKETEIIIKHSLEAEKEVGELRKKLISTASHEFRTPLTTILSSAQLLSRYGKNWDDEKFNSHVDRIEERVYYMVDLIDDLLVISKSDNQKLVFSPKEISLDFLCHSFVEEIESLLTPKHKLIYKAELLREKYFVDDKILKYIIINLLTNAIKYSPDGGKIMFSVVENDNQLSFIVADEGIGISTKDQKYLFESFHRGENVGDIKGTGLGMSIIKRYVELHSGEIEYKSTQGKGTTFTVILPITMM